MLFQVLQEAEVAEQQDDANGGDKSFGESFGGGGASSRKSRKFSSGLLDYGEGREKKSLMSRFLGLFTRKVQATGSKKVLARSNAASIYLVRFSCSLGPKWMER